MCLEKYERGLFHFDLTLLGNCIEGLSSLYNTTTPLSLTMDIALQSIVMPQDVLCKAFWGVQ